MMTIKGRDEQQEKGSKKTKGRTRERKWEKSLLVFIL